MTREETRFPSTQLYSKEDIEPMSALIVALRLRIEILTEALEAAAPCSIISSAVEKQVYTALGRPVGTDKP